MTSSSDFFASLNLTDTHGITWLGNYGTRLCVAPSSPRQNSDYDFRARRPNQRPFQSFPGGVCWRFHSGQFCRGCNFKHSCFKMWGPSIPQANAAPTERTVTQAMQPLACPLGVTVRDEYQLLSRGPTPVTPDRLAFHLKGYNNVNLRLSYPRLSSRFFSIRYYGSLLAIRSANLKNAMDNPNSVIDKLSKELAAGRIGGPV